MLSAFLSRMSLGRAGHSMARIPRRASRTIISSSRTCATGSTCSSRSKSAAECVRRTRVCIVHSLTLRLPSSSRFSSSLCRCGERPDAADFALMLKLGELNQLCAKEIPFTLFSGDRGFDETLLHIHDRRVQRVDPHLAGTDEETFALLKSISDV
jgi:hypothetical protein